MKIELETPVQNSFRVQQVSGMFSLEVGQTATDEIEYEEPPINEENWKIGLIVGPSGSGKSTVAKRLFGENLFFKGEWPESKAVIDGFDERLSIKDVTSILTAVGFSSPPAWVKPYSVLSNGEQFRCDLARALSLSKITNNPNTIIAFDEFTSVVDRTVGKVASAAISKGIKNGNIPCRFVAVTCHYDVAEWLEPDWILDMATGKVVRGCLRRPEIKLEVRKSNRNAWPIYRKHHYLNHSIGSACGQYYEAFINGVRCAFLSIVSSIGHKNLRQVGRLVVLPDFQGIGIGIKLLSFVSELYKRQNLTVRIITSNPAMIHGLKKKKDWVLKDFGKKTSGKNSNIKYKTSGDRITATFSYIGNREA